MFIVPDLVINKTDTQVASGIPNAEKNEKYKDKLWLQVSYVWLAQSMHVFW